MNDLLMEELENDAFLEKVYGRRNDDEDVEPEWELVSLDDLDEQQQMEIAAKIERFGETHRLTAKMDAWMDAYYERPEVA